MYRLTEVKQGAAKVIEVEHARFRRWRDAVEEGKRLLAWRRRAVRPKWSTREVRVIDETDESVVWTETR